MALSSTLRKIWVHEMKMFRGCKYNQQNHHQYTSIPTNCIRFTYHHYKYIITEEAKFHIFSFSKLFSTSSSYFLFLRYFFLNSLHQPRFLTKAVNLSHPILLLVIPPLKFDSFFTFLMLLSFH